MTDPQRPMLVVEEFNTPEEIEAAMSDLAGRCNALPPHKQDFLAQTLKTQAPIDLEVIALLVLMLENSDDEYKITSPELSQLMSEAQATVTAQETP
jgi:hypothetical protein